MINDDLIFGRFRLDLDQSVLYRDGEPVQLGRRGILLLAALVKRRGEIVPRTDLIDATWPDEAVEESNLSVQIAALRKRIGHRWIRTVERVGYQLVADATLDRRTGGPRFGLPGIAVLPFADLSTAGQCRRLADGLVEDLTSSLAQFQSLAVAARNSAFLYDGRANDVRSVAQDLGVRYVLEGSVRPVGERFRISAQLIDGATGVHVWAEIIDSNTPESIIEALAATAEAQVHAAEIARSRRERPESHEAYDLYLRARRLLQTSRLDDNLVAHAFGMKALAIEPENPLYIAAAVEAVQHRVVDHALSGTRGWLHEEADLREMRQLALRGIEHAETDAISLGLMGGALLCAFEEDLGSVITDRAVRLNPNSPLALVCDGDSHLWVGSLEVAEVRYARSISLNPTDPNQRFALSGLATIANMRGDFEGGLAFARRSNALSPGYAGAYLELIAASVHLGRLTDARRYLKRYRELFPHATIASIDAGQHYRDRSRIAPLLEALREAGLPAR